MSSQIDHESYIPYYIQVRDVLHARIQDGSWKPGDRLPNETELCEMFRVSRTVIRQALDDLVHKGLVIRRKGKGSFIAEPNIREGLFQKLTDFGQDMLEQGYVLVTQVLRQEAVPASPEVAAYLHVEADTQVIQIEQLRFVQDVPIQLVTTYIPYSLCPALLVEDLSKQSLYAFLEQCCGLVIEHGHRRVEAVPANEDEARLLQVKEGSPLISLNGVSFLRDGTPVEYYHALHRGDRTRFEVELVRVREQATEKDVLDEGLPQELSLSSGLILRSNDRDNT